MEKEDPVGKNKTGSEKEKKSSLVGKPTDVRLGKSQKDGAFPGDQFGHTHQSRLKIK